jgi:hypothetical protein
METQDIDKRQQGQTLDGKGIALDSGEQLNPQPLYLIGSSAGENSRPGIRQISV